ncbi:hypothetical protein [Saccharopolyspora karakumensis]|uniref:hypothetical protein n=1 Tax=Saccharopolyspora karakumensis TaxID=2530386 RepID=UPI001404367E|nr:hypothetical protein [Saccharopolyspora karakumensis]
MTADTRRVAALMDHRRVVLAAHASHPLPGEGEILHVNTHPRLGDLHRDVVLLA